MKTEKNLQKLLKDMQPVLHAGTYVFHFSEKPMSELFALSPVNLFQENGGTACIFLKEVADASQIDYIYPSSMITLKVFSDLDAVGFLAKITNALAAEGISLNPISAYHHDHLFVPVDKADLAMETLENLSKTS